MRVLDCASPIGFAFQAQALYAFVVMVGVLGHLFA